MHYASCSANHIEYKLLPSPFVKNIKKAVSIFQIEGKLHALISFSCLPRPNQERYDLF